MEILGIVVFSVVFYLAVIFFFRTLRW